MLWSWILSLEVHYFIVACIILLILKNHPRYGLIIFSSFLISSLIANTTLRFYDHQTDVKIHSRYAYKTATIKCQHTANFIYVNYCFNWSFVVWFRRKISVFSTGCMTNHGPDCHRTFLAFVLVTSFTKLRHDSKLASEWCGAVCRIQ